MHKQGVFRAPAIGILLTVCLLPGLAHANNVAVNCPGASINAALAGLPPNGPNTITVTGTCNEHVVISDMRSLTIIGVGGAKIVQPQNLATFTIAGSQHITLQDLEIVGVPGSPLGSGGTGVDFVASDVHIIRCDVHDNEGSGVFANGASGLSLTNTTIHNNTPGGGVSVFNGSGANVLGTTIQNNGGGVSVVRNSFIRFFQSNLIQNNAEIGIIAGALSTVFFRAGDTGTIVQGHTNYGIFVNEGGHLDVGGPILVQGNGGACASQTPCSGIFGARNATLELSTGTVNRNQGAGIFAEQGTNVLLNGATISNNSGDGVHIRWISIADFRDFGGGKNVITGNGGASVFCDERSLVIGDLTGLSKVKCRENQQEEPDTEPKR